MPTVQQPQQPLRPPATRRATDVDAFIGRRIALRRTAQGVSQTGLARLVGVSFQQVQKYESGGNRVSCSRLFQIAVALGTEPGAFFPPVNPQA